MNAAWREGAVAGKQRGTFDAPRAKKSLGQHFLKDQNIARNIVRCLDVRAGDHVLEIGPGAGALSVFLAAARPELLLLVEKDAYWAQERNKELTGEGGRAAVFVADAMTLDWSRFVAPWKIIGNLPYNVASPLMWNLLSQVPGLRRAVFMVQKEVGERICAAPCSKAYGALSVWLRNFCEPKWEFSVPPQVFAPRPKVDSAVLSFTPFPPERRPAPHTAERLAALLHCCFQHRRKQLGGTLKGMVPDAVGLLERSGLSAAMRPEALTPLQFRLLAEAAFPACVRQK